MIATGQKVVVVADHSKLHRQALISFGTFQNVDLLIMSSLADQHILDEIKKLGVQVIVRQV